MEIRGKLLNTFKAPEEKILDNEEIKLFLYAIGQNIYDFDKKKLRYGKIGIASDQDADRQKLSKNTLLKTIRVI